MSQFLSDIKQRTIIPNLNDPNLTTTVQAIDNMQNTQRIDIVNEKAITLFLNGQEIVTLMTIGDYPEYLALGYLRNQCMLTDEDHIKDVIFDEETQSLIVYTQRSTNYEKKLRKKITTSGCAQGVLYGDIEDVFQTIYLPEDTYLKTSHLYALLKNINTQPSLYLKAGAIHGCALYDHNTLLLYFEDVGRHNAVDKIAGYVFCHNTPTHDKILYTTGRLTSEMILKTVLMKIPVLISRSGFTSSGIELARKAGLTLIGRAKGKRFFILSGEKRVIFDA